MAGQLLKKLKIKKKKKSQKHSIIAIVALSNAIEFYFKKIGIY